MGGELREFLKGEPEIGRKERAIEEALVQLEEVLDEVLRKAAKEEINLFSESGRKYIINEVLSKFERYLRQAVWSVERRKK